MSSDNLKETKNTTKNKKIITSNSKSLDNDIRLKTVFNSFISNNSNDFSQPHCISNVSTKKNEIFQNIYSKRKIINSLFNMKNSFLKKTNSQKPISLKYFEFGLKKLFFGPDGFITNKISYLTQRFAGRRDHDCYVGEIQHFKRLRHPHPAKLAPVVQPRSVRDKARAERQDFHGLRDRVRRRAGDIRDDRHLLSRQRVYERGFPGVSLAEKRYPDTPAVRRLVEPCHAVTAPRLCALELREKHHVAY